MILMTWAFQVTFGLFILTDAINGNDLDFSRIITVKIGLTRFICGMLLHISCNAEIVNGLKMMKFSVNHHWKFSNYRVAFMAGFAQVMVMFLITIINYMVISISDDVITVAKDFTALMIVADFDDIFGSLSNG